MGKLGRATYATNAYRVAKREMHRHYGYVCHICGHDGAGEADHLVPLSVDPNQAIAWEEMRPAHGSNYPCRWCLRKCNQERGNQALALVFKPLLDW